MAVDEDREDNISVIKPTKTKNGVYTSMPGFRKIKPRKWRLLVELLSKPVLLKNGECLPVFAKENSRNLRFKNRGGE